MRISTKKLLYVVQRHMLYDWHLFIFFLHKKKELNFGNVYFQQNDVTYDIAY